MATTLNKKVSQALTQSRAVKAAQVARPAPPPPQRFGSRLTAPTPPARTAPPPQPRTVAPPPQQQTTAQRFGQRLATPAPVPQPRAVTPPARTTTPPPQQQPVQQPARLGSGLTPPPVVGKQTPPPPPPIQRLADLRDPRWGPISFNEQNQPGFYMLGYQADGSIGDIFNPYDFDSYSEALNRHASTNPYTDLSAYQNFQGRQVSLPAPLPPPPPQEPIRYDSLPGEIYPLPFPGPYPMPMLPMAPIDPNAGMNIQPVVTGFQGFTPA